MFLVGKLWNKNMKTYKNKTVKVVDQIICDICGKVCTDDNYMSEYGILEAAWGYNSRSDGTKYEIHICENCFYDTISWMKNKRSEYIPVYSEIKNDPLNGDRYI